MKSIEGLEIDYLRSELRKAREREEYLAEEIYQWIKSNEESLLKAHKIVDNWKEKYK